MKLAERGYESGHIREDGTRARNLKRLAVKCVPLSINRDQRRGSEIGLSVTVHESGRLLFAAGDAFGDPELAGLEAGAQSVIVGQELNQDNIHQRSKPQPD